MLMYSDWQRDWWHRTPLLAAISALLGTGVFETRLLRTLSVGTDEFDAKRGDSFRHQENAEVSEGEASQDQ